VSDYTPTTEEVRIKHSIADLRKPPHVWDAQFDRWLARVRAEAVRTALEMCFTNPDLAWSYGEVAERLTAWADALDVPESNVVRPEGSQ
jgi:hypothetical protein